MTRRASCNCGQLQLSSEGEPVRVSMCHCFECQRQTGSTFGVQAWFEATAISSIQGEANEFVRPTDSGNSIKFHFCAVCGATVYLELNDLVAIAVGSFADPQFPSPTRSIWESRQHHWLNMIGDLPIEHSN